MEIENEFICDNCGFSTTNIDDWVKHQNMHEFLLKDDIEEFDSGEDDSGEDDSGEEFDSGEDDMVDDMEDDMEDDDIGEMNRSVAFKPNNLKRMNTFDEFEKSINLGKVTPSRNTQHSSFDWQANLKIHGENAIETVNYLFKIIDTTGLMGYQIDILEKTLKYGIKKIQCNAPARYNLKELWCLWDIESDGGDGSGDLEDILCNILQYGVLTGTSTFILNSPRQYKRVYIYKTLKDFILEDEQLVKSVFRGLTDLWLSNIEDIDDDSNYACFRNEYYVLPELIKLIDIKYKWKKVHYSGSEPYTFEQLYNEMVPNDEGTWQHVPDFWENKMLEWHDPELFK